MSPPTLLLILSGLASRMDQDNLMYKNKGYVIHSQVASFWSGSRVLLNYFNLCRFPHFLTNQVQTPDVQGGPPGAGTHTFPTFPFIPTYTVLMCSSRLSSFHLHISLYPLSLYIQILSLWNSPVVSPYYMLSHTSQTLYFIPTATKSYSVVISAWADSLPYYTMSNEFPDHRTASILFFDVYLAAGQ